MSSPSDQQLIQYIGQGRREALAQLFDRYSADLYDYLARLVGDRDQAARLLDRVLLAVPGAAAGFQPRDSVRGWLYSIAREAGLDWLRQRGWLDGLPPSDEPIPPGLQGDVWKAARAMPGFFRAVLITEELQPLSPTEKARALGVNRTDLPRLIEEARKSFNRIYDAQARAEGRPTSDRINTEVVWNARRRLPIEGGSLFGFLPVIEFPESLKQQIRRHIVEAMSPPPARPLGGIAADTGTTSYEVPRAEAPPVLVPPPLLPPGVGVQPEPQPERRLQPIPLAEPVVETPRGGFTGLPTSALAALLGVALALLICGGVFLLLQNRNKPTITSTQPANASTIQQTPEINVFAVYDGVSEIDRTRTTMQIDGRAVIPLFVNNSVAWTGALDPGSHIVDVVVVDRSGNSAEQSWTFFIVAAGTQTATPGGLASVTPISPLASVTPIVPITVQVVTVTPIIIPQTPTSPFATSTFPPPPPTSPLTPCFLGGVSGVAFNDLNGNGNREGEPGLAGITVNLKTQLNSVFSVTITDAFGNYRFTNVPFGSYRVSANIPPGWTATTSTDIPVFIGGCGIIPNFNFGFATGPTPTPTSTFTPPTTFGVINASAFVTPFSSTTCPQDFTFNGTLTTNSAGSVQYRWVRSDGTTRPIQVLPFASAGTQNVAPDVWNVGTTYSGWSRLEVLSPNLFTSPQANFVLNCPGPTTVTPSVTPTITPTFTPTLPPFAVTNATANVSPTSSTTCPETFTFNGTLTANGAGNVTYQWIRSDGASSPPAALTFLTAGTQNVLPETWTLGTPGFNFTGWEKILVLSPNSVTSPEANFTLNCPPPTLTPSPTPTETPLPPSQVTSATVDPASPAVLTTCPGAVNFSGKITTDGPTSVTYEWERSDGTKIGPATISFGGPGTQTVTDSWSFGSPPIILSGLWERINVLTPNALSSSQATFDVNCP